MADSKGINNPPYLSAGGMRAAWRRPVVAYAEACASVMIVPLRVPVLNPADGVNLKDR